MSTQSQGYPEDEFDRAGRDRTPQGVHRAPRSIWRTLLPVIAVVVLAPLLAWGAITLLGGTGADPQATPSEAATAGSAAPTDAATTAPGATTDAPAETTEPPAEEEPPAAPVDTAASIAVLNGAGVNGLAGDIVGRLADAGFANGTAADYGAAEPQGTTLYYNNAELAATARAVGEALGITEIVESAGATSTTDIAIVLRSDFVQ